MAKGLHERSERAYERYIFFKRLLENKLLASWDKVIGYNMFIQITNLGSAMKSVL